MIRVVRRWLPTRRLVLVVDGGLTAVRLGLHCAADSVGITFVSRLRLDAAVYDDPLPQPSSKRGKKAKKGPRQLSLKSRLSSRTTVWQTHEVAWYHKTQPTFSDAIACVRAYLWMNTKFPNSPTPTRLVAFPEPLVRALMDTLCYPA